MSADMAVSKEMERLHSMHGPGFWTLDYDEKGALVSVKFSHEFRALLGYEDETSFPDKIESWTAAIHPADRNDIIGELDRLLADRTGKRSYDVEYRMTTKSGEMHWFHCSGGVIRRADGTPERFIGSLTYITDPIKPASFVENNEAGQTRQKREMASLALLHDVIHFGIWGAELHADGSAKSVYWSDHFREILGFQSEEDFPNTVDAWLSRLHPDDIEIASNQLVKLANSPEKGNLYDDSYRMKVKNGDYRWFRAVARIRRDENGNAVSLVGVFIDVNDAHELAELQTAQQENFDRIMHLAENFESIYDVNIDTGEYTHTNKNGVFTEDLLDNVKLGQEYFDSSAKNIELVVFTQDQPKMLNLVNREHLLEELSEKPVLSEDYRLVIHGKPIWYHMKIVRAGDWSKERRMLVGVFNNERLKQQEAEHKTFSEMTNILCESYESIYYVDMADDSYFMFNNHGGIMEREMELRGRNFFAEAQKNVKTVIHPDDVAMVVNFIDRAHIVRAIEHGEVISTEYRIMQKEECIYYRMRVVKSHSFDNHIVIAVENVDEEVHERRRQQQQLEDALRMAQSANRAKTTFLNNMSHDIRTPMNAIIGFTGLAATHIDNKGQVQDYLEKISQSSEHLLALINDVLDMSRIESGKVSLNEKEESLAEILHMLKDIIQADVNAKHLELFIDTVDIKEERVVCDKLRLDQVLFNILSNAIKYTNTGGKIFVRVVQKTMNEHESGLYEFHIKDTGIGMSEEYLKTIFEPFTREQTATVSGIQGTGLGMAITKNIVDMMGGEISVKSKQGEGTEFIVRLELKLAKGKSIGPVYIDKLKGLRAMVVDDDVNNCLSASKMLQDTGMRAEWCASGQEAVSLTEEAVKENDPFKVYIVDWLMPGMSGVETTRHIRQIVGDAVPIIILTAYDWSDIAADAEEAGATGFISKPMFPSDLQRALVQYCGVEGVAEEIVEEDELDFTGLKVLLVEDNELNREIAEELLKESGFEVDLAEDGIYAVEKIRAAKEGDYDLILMDVQMPIMNGYDATMTIRKIPGWDKIPIIALSANAFEEDRKRSQEAGMNDHIAKPIKVKELFETLKKYL